MLTDPSHLLEQVEKVLLAVISILDKTQGLGEALIDIDEAVQQLHVNFRHLDAHPGGIIASTDSIVAATCRLSVIQGTEFLSAGYALLDGMVLLVFVLMTLSDWSVDSSTTFRVGSAYTIVISYLFRYIQVLVRDLESPFDYPKDYCLECYNKKHRPEDAPAGGQDMAGSLSWNSEQVYEEFKYGGSVKGTTMLTVVFGAQLRTLMRANSNQLEGASALAGSLRTARMSGKSEHRAALDMRKSLRKWRLALRCAPIVFAMVCFRLAVWYGAGVGGWLSSPQLFNAFTRLVVFVSSVVIGGLIRNYKEAEKIPSELVSAFFGATSSVRVLWQWIPPEELRGVKGTQQDDSHGQDSELLVNKELQKQMDQLVVALLKSIEDMSTSLSNEVRDKAALSAMHEVNTLSEQFFGQFIRAESTAKGKEQRGYKLSQPEKYFKAIRSAITRVYLMQSTRYILEAYTLMDLMVLLIFGVLTATDWRFDLTPSGLPAGMAYTVVIPFLFSYLEFFVRNLEGPFDYPPKFLQKCYETAERQPRTLMEEHKCGGRIDLVPLTVSYGKFLKGMKKRVSPSSKSSSKAFNLSPQAQESSGGFTMWGLFIYFLRRYRLVLQALPIVGVMVLLRLGVWFYAGVGGWIDPSMPLAFVGIAIFVTSFLLQTVMQDYYEANRIPCTIAIALQGLEAVVRSGGVVEDIWKPDGKAQERAHEQVQLLFRAAANALDVQDHRGEKGKREYQSAIESFDAASLELYSTFSKPKDNTRRKLCDTAWEAAGLVADVRRAIVRMHRIKKARFILDAYSLMEGILLAVFVLLTLSNWPIEILYGTAMATTIVISGLFTYMDLLIHSMEHPFKYPPEHHAEEDDGAPRKNLYDFSPYNALNCGSPVDPTVLTYLTAHLIREGAKDGAPDKSSSYEDAPSQSTFLLPMKAQPESSSSPINCPTQPVGSVGTNEQDPGEAKNALPGAYVRESSAEPIWPVAVADLTAESASVAISITSLHILPPKPPVAAATAAAAARKSSLDSEITTAAPASAVVASMVFVADAGSRGGDTFRRETEADRVTIYSADSASRPALYTGNG
jgi:hypothetical protein